MNSGLRLGVVVSVVLLGGVWGGLWAAAAVGDPADALKSKQDYLYATGTKTYGTGGAEAVAAAGVTGTYDTSEAVIIAVIGEGIVFSHEDLDAKATGLSQPAAPDPALPGVILATEMAGIAAAETDGTNLGIAGVCRNCRLLDVRADLANADVVAAKLSLAHALASAVATIKAAHGANPGNAQGVLLVALDRNLDPVTPGSRISGDDAGDTALLGVLTAIAHQTTYTDAFDPSITVDAANTAITVVIPAGNGELLPDGTRYVTDKPSFPCAANLVTATEVIPNDQTDDPSDTLTVPVELEPLTVCVGSVDTRPETLGKQSVFSNFGSWVNVTAPGQQILATTPTGYDYLDHTAAAAAIVAGLAARLHAMTYERAASLSTPSLNTPAKVQELLWSAAARNAIPGLADDRTAAEDASTMTLAAAPAPASRWAEALLDGLLGVENVWAGPNDAAANLSQPQDKHLVVPAATTYGRNLFEVWATLRANSYKLELLRHDCGANPPALNTLGQVCSNRSYYAPGAVVATLIPQGTAPSSPNPNLAVRLGKVCADRVVKGTSNCAATGTGGLGTNYWEEGQYSLKLTVTRTVGAVTTTATSIKKLFVDRSFDSTFNEHDALSIMGSGSPLVLGDTIVHGPNLADVAGPNPPTTVTVNGISQWKFDDKPEIIVGSTDSTVGQRIYVMDGTGRRLFESMQLGGPIVGTPAVGNIDADAALEIVATANTGGAPSLFIFDLPNNLWTNPISDAAPSFSAQIGQSKSSPALGKGLQSDSYLSIFVTTVDNSLQWWKWNGTSYAAQGAAAPLTCVTTTSSDPNDYRAMKHYNGSTLGPCLSSPVMESSPLVASLQSQTPIRVFVPSQDPLSTYGYDPQPPTGSPRLKLLPGFPMQWGKEPADPVYDSTHPAPGGSFDSTLAYHTNSGRLQMFDVQYELDSRQTCPAGMATSQCQTNNYCKGKLDVGDAASLKCSDHAKVIVLQVQGATTEVTNPKKEIRQSNPNESAEFDVPGELFMYSGAATGDVITGDYGQLETVLVGASGKVYLFTSEAQLVTPTVATCSDGSTAGWPKAMDGSGAGTPLIADLDGDGQVEIVTTSDQKFLYAWDRNGCLKRTMANGRYGFPRALRSKACFAPNPAKSPIRTWAPADIVRCTTPVIGNLDNDPALEMVLIAAAGSNTTNAVYMWDLVEPPAPITIAKWLRPLRWLLEPQTAWATGTSQVLAGSQCNDSSCDHFHEHALIKLKVLYGTTMLSGATVQFSWPSGISGVTNTYPEAGAPAALTDADPDGDGYNFVFDRISAPSDGSSIPVAITVTASGYPPQTQTVAVAANSTYPSTFGLAPPTLDITGPTCSGDVCKMYEQAGLSFAPLSINVTATDPDGDTITALGPAQVVTQGKLVIGSTATSAPGSTFTLASQTTPSVMSGTMAWSQVSAGIPVSFTALNSCGTTFPVTFAATTAQGMGSRAITIQWVKCGDPGNTSCSANQHPPMILSLQSQGQVPDQYVGASWQLGLVGLGRPFTLSSSACDPDNPTEAFSYVWSYLGSSPAGVTQASLNLQNLTQQTANGTSPSNLTQLTGLNFQVQAKDSTNRTSTPKSTTLKVDPDCVTIMGKLTASCQ